MYSFGLFAQDSGIRFERLSLDQGLSQSSVFGIAQDADGFMWFATQDGLNRYDGYSFVHFEHDDRDSTSLSDNYVTTLLCDHTGTLWVGTRSGGLNRFVVPTGTFVRYRSDPQNPRSIGNDDIRCLYEDRQGTVWIGTTEGLDRYDPGSDAFIRYAYDPAKAAGIPPGMVQSVFEDGRGNLWIGMFGFLLRLDRTTGTFMRVNLPVPGLLANSISEDDKGTLWVALQNDLFCYRDGRWSSASVQLHSPTALVARTTLKDKHGRIWFGADHGLNLYDQQSRTLRNFINDPADPFSLSGNSILSLFEDREGILWVGTYNGINKYAAAQFKFRRVNWKQGTVRDEGWNKVRSFCEDASGLLWIATQSGLMTYDRRSEQLTRLDIDRWYASPSDPRLLWSVLQDRASRGTLWVGTNGRGLIRITVDKVGYQAYKRFAPQQGNPGSLKGLSPVALYETKDGTLWVGDLWDGLNKFDRKSGTFAHYANIPGNPHSLSGNEIWCMCEDASGNLWVGTGGEGLSRLNPTTGVCKQFHHQPDDPTSLSDDKVTSIVEDSARNLWVGTYTGLNRLDLRSNSFEHFTTRNGLPNNVVYGIVDDHQGNLWLSTNNGLSRFTPQTRTFRNYDVGDGLQSNEFNHGAAIRCANGELLFGGVNGFNIFTPAEIVEDTSAPAVVLTDFRVFNKSVTPGPTERRLLTNISNADTIRLTYRDAVLTFDFAALEFTNPGKNRYAYRMVGFDHGWVESGSRREATYTNLDPGTYVFRVKASNSDGFWNQQGTSVVLLVSPPSWETWWFRSIAVLLFLSVGPYVYYRRVSSLKQKQAVHQEFARRLIESQEAERKRVAAELHDSIGQDLLVIKNKLLLGLQENSPSQKSTKDFEDAVGHVSNSLKHIREISRNLRPIQLDQIGLTAALESAIETAAESAQLDSTVTIDNIDRLLKKDEEINLFRIVQESLNNVLKHARATKLTVNLSKTEKSLSLVVEDDGRGMKLSKEGAPVSNGLGLNSMNERARILGGELHIESGNGRGTRVELIIPLGGHQRG